MAKPEISADRFDGNGSKTVHPLVRHITPGTRPRSISRSAARQAIKSFKDTGWSTHSSHGSVLWVILEYCEVHHVSYELKKHDQGEYTGFTVQRLSTPEPRP